jgi:hypothetical protein
MKRTKMSEANDARESTKTGGDGEDSRIKTNLLGEIILRGWVAAVRKNKIN